MKLQGILTLLLVASIIMASASYHARLSASPSKDKKPYVWVWMCLDVCEPGKDELHINQVKAYRSLIDAVSYEAYIVGQGGLLEHHPRVAWDVTPDLKALGVETWPMIVSANIQNIRAVFDNEDSFIAQAVGIALSLNITGFNIDFEPTGGATHQDAVRYAEFLDKFAAELHKHGFKLSVDVARWSPIWDLSLLAKTRVDYIIDMSTYASRDTTFLKYLDMDLAEIPGDKLVVGLCTYNLSSDTLFPESEVAFRFAKLINRGVSRIAIWRTLLPVSWIRYIKLYREAMPIPATITTLGAVTVTDTVTKTETVTRTVTTTSTSTTISTTVSTRLVPTTRTMTVTSTLTRTSLKTSVTTLYSTKTTTVTRNQYSLAVTLGVVGLIIGLAAGYLGRRS